MYRYSYSKTRGLFGGVSLEGSVIVERQDANFQAYESPVTARLLLGGTVDPPQWALPLIKTLEACTGMPGTRQWVNDEGSRTPGGTYVFGKPSTSSSRSSISRLPSFLRKKKSDSPSFPPASWGVENENVSYFNTPESDPSRSHLRNKTWDIGDRHSSSTEFDSSYDAFNSKQKQSTLNSWDAERDSGTPTVMRRNTNPFNADINPNTNGYRRPTSENTSHQRSMSLRYDRAPTIGYTTSPFVEDPSYQNTFSSQASKVNSSSQPFNQNKAVIRAIALYDFTAVQVSWKINK